MHLSDFDYELPPELIARYPPEERGTSRMLVADRDRKNCSDHLFTELPDYLEEGDCIVLNTTRVIPARLIGKRSTTGALIEIFLHQREDGFREIWHTLAAPAKKAKVGETIEFGPGLCCTVLEDVGPGEKRVEFNLSGAEFSKAIDEVGEVPLPPYLNRQADASDKERYQTIYASVRGAVAAPTAGLHFTPDILRSLEIKGIRTATVVLHTGLGTFRPVEVENIAEHKMHREYYEVSAEAARIINETKQEGKRVLAVGTTTVRTLETASNENGTVQQKRGFSEIFIYPPYRFKVPTAILTNFHMPRSTLVMMIAAFMGRDFLFECYRHAIQERYRFFSYGDAMLIL